MALGGVDLRRNDDDALCRWQARARGPGRVSRDGAGQDVARCAAQQGELVPGLYPRDTLHAAHARGAAVADANALSADQRAGTRAYARHSITASPHCAVALVETPGASSTGFNTVGASMRFDANCCRAP